MPRSVAIPMFALAILSLAACSHDLRIRNLDQYQVPFRSSPDVHPLRIAVRPFQGQADDLFYYNTILERLNQSGLVSNMQTNYAGRNAGGVAPDLILTVSTSTNYRTSLWNFFVNWPGFLIFTPAWNGYVYRADILTRIEMEDERGKFDELVVPISYNLRHAEFDRTVFTGLTWLEVSALAFFGGIYNATSFDRDVIAPLQLRVKDAFGQYVVQQLDGKVADASRVLKPGTAAATRPEPGARRSDTLPANTAPQP